MLTYPYSMQAQSPRLRLLGAASVRGTLRCSLFPGDHNRNAQQDVINVSNSVSVEATKFLLYIRTLNATAQDPINTAINAYTLKNLISGAASNTAVFTSPTPIISPVSP